MGCVGMSYDDFCRCTPSEFSAVTDMWNKREESLKRRSWEQTRDLIMAIYLPFSSKPIKATDILQFEWDKKNTPSKPAEKSTRERFEQVKARLKKLKDGK